jgi:predicted secreted protein
MSKLGLTLEGRIFAVACAGTLAFACKTSPETAPPGASAPTAAAAQPAPPSPAPAVSGSAGAAAPPRTYDSSTKTIDVAVGDAFNVALPSNITVPFKWRVEPPPDPKILAGGDDKYVEQPPADCAACTGYGGTRLFPFAATAPGTVTLHFAQRPLSDAKGPAQKEVTITVNIK